MNNLFLSIFAVSFLPTIQSSAIVMLHDYKVAAELFGAFKLHVQRTRALLYFSGSDSRPPPQAKTISPQVRDQLAALKAYFEPSKALDTRSLYTAIMKEAHARGIMRGNPFILRPYMTSQEFTAVMSQLSTAWKGKATQIMDQNRDGIIEPKELLQSVLLMNFAAQRKYQGKGLNQEDYLRYAKQYFAVQQQHKMQLMAHLMHKHHATHISPPRLSPAPTRTRKPAPVRFIRIKLPHPKPTRSQGRPSINIPAQKPSHHKPMLIRQRTPDHYGSRPDLFTSQNSIPYVRLESRSSSSSIKSSESISETTPLLSFHGRPTLKRQQSSRDLLGDLFKKPTELEKTTGKESDLLGLSTMKSKPSIASVGTPPKSQAYIDDLFDDLFQKSDEDKKPESPQQADLLGIPELISEQASKPNTKTTTGGFGFKI